MSDVTPAGHGPSAIGEDADVGNWQPISTAPPFETVLCWAASWRSPFPGKKLPGEEHFVWIDTCELEARGRREYATHWRPMPKLPDGYGKLKNGEVK